MKKFLLIAALVFATTAVYAQQTIKVGATPEPHAEILNLIKDDLAAKGVKLEVVEFTDYVTPNDAVEAGDMMQTISSTSHILIPSTRRRDIIW